MKDKCWPLSPQGRKPQDEVLALDEQTEDPHYTVAISLLGSRIPEIKALVGMYEHTTSTIGSQIQHNNKEIYCTLTEYTVIKENKE